MLKSTKYDQDKAVLVIGDSIIKHIDGHKMAELHAKMQSHVPTVEQLLASLQENLMNTKQRVTVPHNYHTSLEQMMWYVKSEQSENS